MIALLQARTWRLIPQLHAAYWCPTARPCSLVWQPFLAALPAGVTASQQWVGAGSFMILLEIMQLCTVTMPADA